MFRITFCRLFLFAAAAVLIAGCSQPLVISDVDYSQPIESVIVPDEEGIITDRRYGVAFNILPLQQIETGDTSAVTTPEVRLIRGREGFYYLTAPGYRQVYILAPEEGSLRLEHQVMIAEEGIDKPALNQRDDHIQLLSRTDNRAWSITPDGTAEMENHE